MKNEEVLRYIENLRERGRKFKEKVIGVLMGGESEEREISLKTGNAVLSALKRIGYKAQSVILPEEIQKMKEIDVGFICLHGRGGEDGTIQGFCEIMKIPYTSTDVVSSAITMHKGYTRIILLGKVPQPEFYIVREEDIKDVSFKNVVEKIGLPFIVKPVFSGSTIGISVVRNEREFEDAKNLASQYSKEIIFEEFIGGKEITVGMIDDIPLGTLEIRFEEDIFSYSAKYKSTKTEYIVPPEISEDVIEKAESISKICAKTFGIKGVSRIDFRLKDRTPIFLEINTVPGLTERSLVPKIAQSKGISFEELVEAILGTASIKTTKR